MQNKQCLLNWLITSYITSDNFDNEKSLLFLHWRGQNKLSFEKIYKFLDFKNISYIALDFPWFWSSSFPDFDWQVSDYANFTKNFITKTSLKKPILIWHSFWWRVCLILGSEKDYDNIDKIIMIWWAWIKPKINKLKLYIIKTWKFIFSTPWLKKIWEKIKKNIWSRDYLASWKMKNIFLNAINKDLTNLLQKIKYPTLLLRGEKDTETPLKDWILMNEKIKNSKLKVFENKTHFVHQEIPKEIFEEIDKFIL